MGRRGTNNSAVPKPADTNARPSYFEEDGLRKVEPYHYSFTTYAKARWQGRTLLDVFTKEFRDRSQEYYEWAIESGAVLVNNEVASASHVLINGDLIANVLHRHEPPVVAGAIKILYDGRLPGNDGTTLVVEKPGSMPVHATGRYNHNTLLSILKYDYGLPLVHTSNRLDRLTSGVMVCSLTVQGSKDLGAWFGGDRIAEGGVKKEYVARCLGKFPDGEVACNEPLLTIDRQMGVNVVHAEGRPSQTFFRRLSYHAESNTSAVHCRPVTGRSHQIRVHLQFLGFPIANDPVYQNTDAWGESGGKGGVFARATVEDEATQADKAEARRIFDEEALQIEIARVASVKAKVAMRVAAKRQKKLDDDLESLIAAKKEQRQAKREAAASALAGPIDELDEEAPLVLGVRSSVEEQDSVPAASTSTCTVPAAPSTTHTAKGPSPMFNRRGHFKGDARPADFAQEDGTDNCDRLDFELPLTPAAAVAINALRSFKDSEDGWSRWRDMKAVERARASTSHSVPAPVDPPTEFDSAPALLRSAAPTGPPPNVLDEESDSAFCSDCFVPLVRDPRPDQLFIWLHALRYKTTEWDWCSELPYWALETWEPSDVGPKPTV